MGRDMSPTNLSTKRRWIAELARRKPGEVLTSLHHMIDLEWMQKAYELTRKDGATGIDGVMADEYRGEPGGQPHGPHGSHQIRPLPGTAGAQNVHSQGGRLATAARHPDPGRQGGAAGDRHGVGGRLRAGLSVVLAWLPAG